MTCGNPLCWLYQVIQKAKDQLNIFSELCSTNCLTQATQNMPSLIENGHDYIVQHGCGFKILVHAFYPTSGSINELVYAKLDG